MFNLFHRSGSNNESDQRKSTSSFPIHRRKKTREEVERDLLDNIRRDVKKKLDREGIPIEEVELDRALHQLANVHFQRTYDYLYDTNPTACRPSLLAPNGKITSLASSHSMKPQDISGTLPSSIRTLIAEADLYGEVKDRAIQDLTNVSRLALNNPGGGGINWDIQPYSRTFEYLPEDDPDGERNAIRVDGILIFCNARLKEDDQDMSQSIFYCMAVYYEVTSELVKKRNEFQNHAISSAKEFSNCVYRLRSETDLTRAFESYAQKLFNMKFQFEYADEKPPDLARNLGAEDVKRRLALFSSNRAREDWFTDLARQFFTDLQFPDEYRAITGRAINDLAQSLLDFSRESTNAEWESKSLNRAYPAPNEDLKPTRFSGYMFHYQTKGKTNQEREVSLTYVFILGVFYESVAVQS